MLLAGDIGGTKSDLALFDSASGPRVPLKRARYASQQFPCLQAIVHEFLQGNTLEITGACFGVAAPVVDGHAEMTNLPWTIDEAALRADLHVPFVRLLNDVQATACAIPSLDPSEVETIVDGDAARRGAIALIAPGTGLGEAFLVWDGMRYWAQPSEGGHVEFAPSDDDQLALLAYMRRRHPHVSYERVCSGIGIPHIYDFLQEIGAGEEIPAVAERLLIADDRTRAIFEAATGPGVSPLCMRTLEMFVSILAAEAGNLALKVVATGGVYLAGGIPRAIVPALRSERFRNAFRDKGRLSDLVARIPVRLITGEAALWGAAIAGFEAYGGTTLQPTRDVI
jgi:glucokinase